MFKLGPEDRLPHPRTRASPWERVAILIVVAGIGAAIVYYEWKKYQWQNIIYSELQGPRSSGVSERSGSASLSASELQRTIQRHRDELSREACYKDAVIGLSDALVATGYPRESANTLLNFVKQCGGPTDDLLERAYHSFVKVNDFASALPLAENLVTADPADGTYRHYRAQAHEHLKDYNRALEDYINAVQLLGNPARVAGNPFYRIARMYAALGRYCDAITPIETYVSFDPANRQSTQSTKLISEYAQKGDCHTRHASGFARVRFLGATGVHTLSVVVNGAAGNFILDTGATYVSVTPEFATKAKIKTEGATVISIQPIGGIISAYLTHANKIAVGSAEAQGVPVAVLKQVGVDPFGSRLDGLLGMSFLARFKVTLTQGGLELRAIPLR